MQPEDGSSAFCTILDVRIARITALDCRWFGTGGQNELNGSRSWLAVEFDEADRRQFMRAKGWVLRMQVHDLLPNVMRKCAFILPGDLWWRRSGQQRSHARLVKKIGAVVNRARRHPCFCASLLWRLAPKDDRADDFILNLCWVLEQRLDLLPIMARLSALISAFGHACPFQAISRWIPLKGILHGLSSLGQFLSQGILSICVNSPVSWCPRNCFVLAGD